MKFTGILNRDAVPGDKQPHWPRKEAEREHFDSVVANLKAQYPNWSPTGSKLTTRFEAYFAARNEHRGKPFIPFIKEHFYLQ